MAPCVLAVCLMQNIARADDSEWQRLLAAAADAEAAGDYRASLAAYQEVLHQLEQQGIGDQRLLRAVNLLACAYELVGRYSDAETYYRRALKIAESTGGQNTPDYAVLLSNLGTLLVDQGQSARGLPLLRKSLDMNRTLLPAGDLRIAVMENALARGLLSVRDYREAEPLLEKALAIWRKNPDASPEVLETLMHNVAGVRQYQGRWDESRQLIEEAMASFERRRGSVHPALIRPLNNLAVAYTRMGKYTEAESAFRRALDLCEQFLSPGDQVHTAILSTYSDFLQRAGRKSEARSFRAKAKAAMRDAARQNGMGLTVDISTLRGK
jgi:tetratricopeptide (TPR) repeat protein